MKILLKIYTLILICSALLFAAGNIGQANVGQYTVTLKKLEIYNSTTNKWIQISGSASTVDIASVSAGADIASMISQDAAITYGTYTKARATIGNTFTVKACNAAGTACTNNTISGGSVTNGAIPLSGTEHTAAVAFTSTAPLAGATAVDMTIDFSDPSVTLPSGVTLSGSDVVAEYTLVSSFTIDENSIAPSVSVNFDVNNVLTSATLGTNIDAHGGNEDYIIVDFPTVTVTIN